jgi:hypothetical protein
MELYPSIQDRSKCPIVRYKQDIKYTPQPVTDRIQTHAPYWLSN